MIFAMQSTHFKPFPCVNGDEGQLIAAAKAGDLEAFNRIVLKYQDLLFRIAYRISADEDQANDAVQDAFLSAFQQIRSVQGNSMKSWLIRIVVNKCKDHWRAAYRRRALSLDRFFTQTGEQSHETALDVPDKNLSVEGCVEMAELDRTIQTALQSLPVNLRSILILGDVEGMSYEEISIIQCIPIGTVKSRLARARIRVRGILLRQSEGRRESH